MSDYVIITDTSADIPADILDKGQIHLIPMVYLSLIHILLPLFSIS